MKRSCVVGLGCLVLAGVLSLVEERLAIAAAMLGMLAFLVALFGFFVPLARQPPSAKISREVGGPTGEETWVRSLLKSRPKD
jgi:hypothetical protein